MSSANRWKYVSSFDAKRRSDLTSFESFGEVKDLLKHSIQSISLRPCQGKASELTACIQPIFTLSVTLEAFDVFFNSPVGYRGSYLTGPNDGLVANLALIESLLERLLSFANNACIAELSSSDVRASLLATSCKEWVHEVARAFKPS